MEKREKRRQEIIFFLFLLLFLFLFYKYWKTNIKNTLCSAIIVSLFDTRLIFYLDNDSYTRIFYLSSTFLI